jgi:hypothetical protein
MESRMLAAAPRTVRTALLGILAAGVLAVIFMSWAMLGRMMRPPQSESMTQLAEAKTSAVEIVVEVKRLDWRGTISALLLEPGAAASGYIRTKTPVQITPQRSTRYVMGSAADLVNGAVIDVRGIRETISPLTILADQVVILSGSVTVR